MSRIRDVERASGLGASLATAMHRHLVTAVLVLAAFAAGFGVRGCAGERSSPARGPAPVLTAPESAAVEAPQQVSAPRRNRATSTEAPESVEESAEPQELPPADEGDPSSTDNHRARGRCVDVAGRPIAGVLVIRAPAMSWNRVVSSDDGRFETGVRPDADRYLRFVPNGPFAPRRVPLAAPEGGAIDLGDVVLLAGGTLRGVFLDLDDRPIAGAPIMLHDIDATCSARVGATTGRDGRFVLDHVPDGRCGISSRSPGCPLAPPEQDAQLWPVRAGDDVVLRVRSRHFVRFDYVDEEGSTVRIAGPRVRWYALDDPSEGESWEWEGGHWDHCFVPVRPGATYEIQYEIDGWLPLTHRFDGGEEAERRVRLVFRKAAR
jgi:hypothetical protein